MNKIEKCRICDRPFVTQWNSLEPNYDVCPSCQDEARMNTHPIGYGRGEPKLK